jgi:hypothetical protein
MFENFYTEIATVAPKCPGNKHLASFNRANALPLVLKGVEDLVNTSTVWKSKENAIKRKLASLQTICCDMRSRWNTPFTVSQAKFNETDCLIIEAPKAENKPPQINTLIWLRFTEVSNEGFTLDMDINYTTGSIFSNLQMWEFSSESGVKESWVAEKAFAMNKLLCAYELVLRLADCTTFADSDAKLMDEIMADVEKRMSAYETKLDVVKGQNRVLAAAELELKPLPKINERIPEWAAVVRDVKATGDKMGHYAVLEAFMLRIVADLKSLPTVNGEKAKDISGAYPWVMVKESEKTKVSALAAFQLATFGQSNSLVSFLLLRVTSVTVVEFDAFDDRSGEYGVVNKCCNLTALSSTFIDPNTVQQIHAVNEAAKKISDAVTVDMPLDQFVALSDSPKKLDFMICEKGQLRNTVSWALILQFLRNPTGYCSLMVKVIEQAKLGWMFDCDVSFPPKRPLEEAGAAGAAAPARRVIQRSRNPNLFDSDK